MLIPVEKDKILSSFENGMEHLKSPDEKNGGFFPSPELPYYPLTLPIICTDPNLVPENPKTEIDLLVTNLEAETIRLQEKKKILDEKRKGLLNKIIDIKGNIRVFCRIRPILWSCGRKNEEPISIDSGKVVVRSAGNKKVFDFEKVFCQSSTQADVFDEVEPILRSALDGHNVCILAYGQTGTGKTFTMEGTNEQPGIVPRALKELFHQASTEKSSHITFSISMLEVYMGNLKDLLAPRYVRRAYEPLSRCNLNIQADAKGGVEIEGLTEVRISDFSKAIWWYNKGRRARATSFTNVNDSSSRSHCLMRIAICHHNSEGESRVSKLWMVDLGGSERLLKTGAVGLTLDEGRAINLSLSALGDVIASLRKRRPHVPYRNSKLTQILRDSLGNGSKALMLVHISPNEEDLGETICSITFARRARAVESNHELPEEIKKQRENRIAELSKEMIEAEEECRKVQSQLHKAEFLLAENRRVLQLAGIRQVSEDDEENTQESGEKYAKEERVESVKKRSLPHFMNPTAASRHRQNPMDRETNFTMSRVLRCGTRSSMQLSASQSLSFLDLRLRTILKNGTTKSNDKPVKNNHNISAEARPCYSSHLTSFAVHRKRKISETKLT